VRRRMDVPQVDGPVAVFCGIARPEQFFAGLEARGLKLVARQVFADHHRYTEKDVKSLVELARKANVKSLMTTEKDFMRLGDLTAAFRDSLSLQTAELTIEFDDEQSVGEWLRSRLAETDMAHAHRDAVQRQPAG